MSLKNIKILLIFTNCVAEIKCVINACVRHNDQLFLLHGFVAVDTCQNIYLTVTSLPFFIPIHNNPYKIEN